MSLDNFINSPETLASIQNLADMQQLTASVQNQAHEANNDANKQVLQTVERMQKFLPTLLEQISQMNTKITVLETKLSTTAKIHTKQVKALDEKINQMENQLNKAAKREKKLLIQISNLETKLNKLKERHKTHSRNVTLPNCGPFLFPGKVLGSTGPNQ